MTPDPAFHSARSFDAALDRLADVTQALGLDAVDYGFMPQARTADGRYNAPEIFWRNWPSRIPSGWTRYSREDPFLYAVYGRTLPLDWNLVRDAEWLSPFQREALSYVGGCGIQDGLTVPIHLPDGAFAFVSAANTGAHGRWRQRQEQVRQSLFMLAHEFHAAVAPRFGLLRSRGTDTPLSARESEILAFAAQGCSAPETARRLCRSVETVRRQRKAAMEKLGAHTMAQAVAVAMRRDLIAMPAH